jgi:hypothetical protein
MESVKTSLRRIMAHMETQAVTRIDVQEPTTSRDAYDWSLTSTFEFRSWDMPDGIDAFNTLVTVDRQDSGDYFKFLISFEVQTAIYHFYQLRQVPGTLAHDIVGGVEEVENFLNEFVNGPRL